jgi:branched-chain amino acid transport system ATP-binding protein
MLSIQEATIKFGGLTAVNQVTFNIPKGAIFGLIGPNGAGKTTLFNIISGVYAPTSGKIVFENKEIQGLPPHKINYLGISRTYQNINLFKKMTVLENVMVGCHSRTHEGLTSAILRTPKQRLEEANVIEKSMAILDFMDLTDKATQKASSLSYGEQRRLEISRAMASDPKLLLLDEPAAGMNGREKDELRETIQKISDRGITVLLVEHDMKLVMNVTHQICVLNYGKKIAEGDPESIQNHQEVIAAYLGGGIDG